MSIFKTSNSHLCLFKGWLQFTRYIYRAYSPQTFSVLPMYSQPRFTRIPRGGSRYDPHYVAEEWRHREEKQMAQGQALAGVGPRQSGGCQRSWPPTHRPPGGTSMKEVRLFPGPQATTKSPARQCFFCTSDLMRLHR